MFADQNRRAIGIAACDVDTDGKEEIYILNTDSFSGKKIYADRLLDFDDNRNFKDLFEDSINKQSLNFIAGRSVACVDRMGNGKILFMYLIMEGLQDFIVFKEKK